MKSIKNIIFISIGVILLLAQIIYVFTFRKDMMNEIRGIQDDNGLAYAELLIQEKQLQDLPSLKKQSSETQTQKNAMKDKIPTTLSAARELAALLRIVQTHGFTDINIEALEQVNHNKEMGNFLEKKYKLKYTATYDETRQFIEALNASYQLINITSCKIDNSPQTKKEDITLWLKYAGEMNKVVTTQIEFSMIMLKEISTEDELYMSIFTSLHQGENVFFNTDSIEQIPIPLDTQDTGQNQIPSQTGTQTSTAQQSMFKLDLWDVLASGDNYSFVGPGPTDTIYTGLKSSKNTYITLNIREEGYDIAIEDEAGNVKQNGALIPIKTPHLSIQSNIVKIQENMPDVRIYIKNHTKDTINVQLKGSLLDKIHIYNELEQQVLPGQTKGKVKLT